MKIKYFYILLSLLLLTFNTYSQELNLFTLTARSNEAVFISLSDIDRLSEHPDSLAIPNLGNIEKDGYEKFLYAQLSSKYRTQFLTRTKVAETDSIFIYSYLKDMLVSIPVNELKTVTWLNGYTSPEECPCPDYYYQIGFEIENKYLKCFQNDYTNTLAFIGKNSPFIRNQVEPIVWEEIDNTEFPTKSITLEVKYTLENNDFEYGLGQSYKFENDKYDFFIRKLLKENRQFGLRLLVIDRKTEKNIFEKLYYSGEGTSFAPLDNQWVGNLFKNKPKIIYGFQWHSFDCPIIDFIDYKEKPITIKCDNRH